MYTKLIVSIHVPDIFETICRSYNGKQTHHIGIHRVLLRINTRFGKHARSSDSVFRLAVNIWYREYPSNLDTESFNQHLIEIFDTNSTRDLTEAFKYSSRHEPSSASKISWRMFDSVHFRIELLSKVAIELQSNFRHLRFFWIQKLKTVSNRRFVH